MDGILKRINWHSSLISIFLVLAASGAACGEEINMDKAIGLFYKRNYDLLISAYEINRASADLTDAGLLPNPNLSLNYAGLDPSGKEFPGNSDNSQMTVRLEQTLQFGNKREFRRNAASENLESARLTYRDTLRNLLAGFYASYYGLCLDRLNVGLASSDLEGFERTFRVAEEKYKRGLLSLNDYTRLKAAMVDLESSLAGQRARYNNDVEAFNLLLGGDGRYEPEMVPESDKFEGYREEELVQKAQSSRPDLLAADRQISASRYNLSLARASRIPDLTFGVEYESFGAGYVPGVGAGVSIDIPIFNRNQGEIARKSAEYDQSSLKMEKIRRQVTADIRVGLNNYSSSLAVFRSYRARKVEMEELLQNTEKSFLLGGITVLDLLDVRKAYRSFVANYNQAFIQAVLNRELLKNYMGEIR